MIGQFFNHHDFTHDIFESSKIVDKFLTRIAKLERELTSLSLSSKNNARTSLDHSISHYQILAKANTVTGKGENHGGSTSQQPKLKHGKLIEVLRDETRHDETRLIQ